MSSQSHESASPFYYAEYLPNISSITLTLHSPPDSTYGLHPSGSSLRVTFTSTGETASVPLPAYCNAHNSGLRITQDPSEPYTVVIRLPAQQPSPAPDLTPDLEDEDSRVPWRARQLQGADVEVKCAKCMAVLVERGTVSTWKDLPREGWAELMDLWHCHKPDDEDGQGDGLVGSGKGYAAGNRLVARRGTGFVDVIGFLLRREDCVGVEIQGAAPTTPSTRSSIDVQRDVLCRCCRTLIGAVDDESGGLRLWKPYLGLSIQPSPPRQTVLPATTTTAKPSPPPPAIDESSSQSLSSQTLPMEKWLAAHLLSLVSSTGVRKFKLRTSPRALPYAEDSSAASNGAGLRAQSHGAMADREIWVFSTSVTYTSSTQTDRGPVEALKVFYRSVACSDTDAAGESKEVEDGSESLRERDLMIEEVRLPGRLEEELWGCLGRSNGMLPQSGPGGLGGRKFGEWDVGMLARFTEGDLKES